MIRNVMMALALFAAVPGHAAAAPSENAEEAQLLGYGEVELSKGHPQSALDRYFDPIIKRYERAHPPSATQVYCARTPAETLLYLGMAASEKKSAVALSSVWADALFYKAYAMVDLARAAEARPLFERALALSPKNARYLSELANGYQVEKNWPKSLELYQAAESATEFSPDSAKATELGRALRGQAYVLVELGRLDEAEALYRRCLRLDPDDKTAQRELDYVASQRAKTAPR